MLLSLKFTEAIKANLGLFPQSIAAIVSYFRTFVLDKVRIALTCWEESHVTVNNL